MRRVEADEKWSLMCPDECPGLYETWGEEFDKLYERLVTVCTCTFSESVFIGFVVCKECDCVYSPTSCL